MKNSSLLTYSTNVTYTYDEGGIRGTKVVTENNLKYLYDYDSLGRVIRQKIQTNDTFAHVGSTELTYDVRNNVTKVSSEFGGYTATDEYMFSSNSGAANAANYAMDNLISRYRINNSVNVDYLYDELKVTRIIRTCFKKADILLTLR